MITFLRVARGLIIVVKEITLKRKQKERKKERKKQSGAEIDCWHVPLS